MGNGDILSQAKVDVLALVLLATIELDVFDIFATFFGTAELGGNPYFVLSTFVLSFFGMLILALCALRLHDSYGDSTVGGARTGAYIGFVSSLGVCVVVGVFSLAGSGMERLVPAFASSWGTGRLATYAIIFAAIVASYTLAGALLGGLPWIPRKILGSFGLGQPSYKLKKKGIWA